MTKEQLKTLATIPAILDALKSLAAEIQQMQQLMASVGMSRQSHIDMNPAPPTQFAYPQSPGPINLDTPERQEYRAAMLKPKKTVDQLPARQREAIQSGYMAGLQGERDSVMEQFKHDANPGRQLDMIEREPEQLENLSEAT